MAHLHNPADISDQQLDEIRDLEKNLGKVIVAVESGPAFAELSDIELANLQTAEKEMGMVMLAYENN